MRKHRVVYHRTDLFDVMTAQGRSQRWLAGQLGIDESLLSKMKRGERPIPGPLAEQAAALLGLPVATLFFAPEVSDETDSVSLETCSHGA